LATHQTSRPDLIGGHSAYAIKAASAEIGGGQAGNAISDAGISIGISDIYVRDINVSAEVGPAVKSASPPGVKSFKRREGHPTDIPKPKAEPDAAAITEPAHERRGPEMTIAARAWIPAPSETGIEEPAPVMIRRPAPGIVAHPGPAIPIFPDPAAG